MGECFIFVCGLVGAESGDHGGEFGFGSLRDESFLLFAVMFLDHFLDCDGGSHRGGGVMPAFAQSSAARL